MSTENPNWIVGRGLLGRAVEARVPGLRPFRLSIPWSDEDAAIATLRTGVRSFLTGQNGNWRVYWTAGRGVTSTHRSALDREVRFFRAFLDELASLSVSQGTRGQVFLASSVGGAYGGRTDPPYSESTPPLAASDYGEAKLAAEAALVEWSAATGHRAFIGRITNLYGPGQDLDKGQGIISTLIRSYIAQTPASVWVDLDTLRDYVYVHDCADVVLAGMERLSSTPPGSTTTKIIGSMSAVSIAEVLGEVRRLLRGRAPISLGGGSITGHATDLSVRSRVWTDLDRLVRTTLPAGIHSTYLGLLASRIDPESQRL